MPDQVGVSVTKGQRSGLMRRALALAASIALAAFAPARPAGAMSPTAPVDNTADSCPQYVTGAPGMVTLGAQEAMSQGSPWPLANAALAWEYYSFENGILGTGGSGWPVAGFNVIPAVGAHPTYCSYSYQSQPLAYAGQESAAASANANTVLYSPDSEGDVALSLAGVGVGQVLAQFDRVTGVGAVAGGTVSDTGVAALRTYVGVPTDPDWWTGTGLSTAANAQSWAQQTAANPQGCVSANDPRYWCPRAMVPTLVLAQDTGGGFSDDSTSHMSYEGTNKFPWDYKTNGKKAVDGLGWTHIYRAETEPNPAWDYWATSQGLSLTPKDGWRMKKVFTQLGAGEHMQMVNFSPVDVRKYGSSGSITLSATLSGEAKWGNYQGGAGVGIGRTWDVAEGSAGGAPTSHDQHYGIWEAGNKAGSSTAKAAEGQETWKVPPSDDVYWNGESAWATTK
jgi:hypothetical protein